MDKPRPDLKKIAHALKAERERRGLTQPKLAAMYELSQSQISDLEREATRTLSSEVEAFLTSFLGKIPRLELADLEEPDPGGAEELQHALARVRQLYRLKTQKPPRREHEHDWKVLLALLEEYPADSERERRRTRKE